VFAQTSKGRVIRQGGTSDKALDNTVVQHTRYSTVLETKRALLYYSLAIESVYGKRREKPKAR
jgi:hypothetical protein